MVIVDVELLRFLLVRPTWCHSAAKSRWRAQAPSQRSPPDTTRLLRCTNAKIRKGHRNFEGIFARWKIAGKTRESQTSVGQRSCLERKLDAGQKNILVLPRYGSRAAAFEVSLDEVEHGLDISVQIPVQPHTPSRGTSGGHGWIS